MLFVLYFTGSVNAGNCVELAHKPDVDGFLVGGASLKVSSLLFSLCSTFDKPSCIKYLNPFSSQIYYFD